MKLDVGTKVQIFEGGEWDDHGEVVEIRGRDAMIRWHASGLVATTPCADLMDLAVAEWSWDPRYLPENLT